MTSDPKPWKLLRTEQSLDLQLFQAEFRWLQNPRNGKNLRRLVLNSRDWVNVTAITPEGKIVLVRQYRFGVDKVTTEIPGGILDPGETSKEAAIRELREETGYTSDKWTCLGPVEPNPAFQTNLCHQWLAEEATKTHARDLDDGEDITVLTLTLEEVREEIKSGRLSHSLALSGLSRVFDLWSDLSRYGFSEEDAPPGSP